MQTACVDASWHLRLLTCGFTALSSQQLPAVQGKPACQPGDYKRILAGQLTIIVENCKLEPSQFARVLTDSVHPSPKPFASSFEFRRLC